MKNSFAKLQMSLKTQAPNIFVVIGGIGVVAATVLACRATIKAKPVIDEAKKNLNDISEKEKKGEIKQNEAVQQKVKEMTSTGAKLAKTYGPAVALEVASVVSIGYSHQIMRNRNKVLAVSSAAAIASMKEYRERVRKVYGDEADKNLANGIIKKVVKTTEKDEEGNEKEVEKTVDIYEPQKKKPWEFCFSDECRSAHANIEHDILFIRCEQQVADDRLKARGFIFLNEILERLDIPQTKEGQYLGWIYSTDEDKRDGYIDFGVSVREVDGEEKIFLNFNVDGMIVDEFQAYQMY